MSISKLVALLLTTGAPVGASVAGAAEPPTLSWEPCGVLTQLNDCAIGVFLASIEDATLPPAGAGCDQDVPFAAPAARRSPAPLWRLPAISPIATTPGDHR